MASRCCSTRTARRGASATRVPTVVPAAGGTELPLVVPEGAGGWLSPDGKRYAYTPVMREFRTWKRYHGGRAQDVWIYDLAANTSERITDYDGTDNQPVWLGDTIYFTSDRGANQKLNLWAHDVRTKRQSAGHDPRPLRRAVAERRPRPVSSTRTAATSTGSIPPPAASTRVDIRVAGDFRGTVPTTRSVKSEIQSAELSPTGKRALFEAHGDVFTAPAKEGEIRNLTSTPGIRETGADVVAERPLDRVPLRSHGRVRDLRSAGGRIR